MAETTFVPLAAVKRAKDAIAIQGGACNPLAIMNTMLAHARLMDGGFDKLRADPAMRLMAHQLAYLFNTRELDDSPGAYARMYDQCEHDINNLLPKGD